MYRYLTALNPQVCAYKTIIELDFHMIARSSVAEVFWSAQTEAEAETKAKVEHKSRPKYATQTWEQLYFKACNPTVAVLSARFYKSPLQNTCSET